MPSGIVFDIDVDNSDFYESILSFICLILLGYAN